MENLKHKAIALLRWSERYTKTDMVYLAKGGFWLVLEHGIQILSGLFLSIAFANLLPKNDYGVYQFVMAGTAILGSFTLSGMATAVTYAVAKGSEGALRYGFKIKMIWNSSIVASSGAVALYYFLNGNTMLASAFLIAGALIPFIDGFSLYNSYLVGKQLFRENTMLGFWRKPLPVAAMIISLFVTDDPIILIFVYFASNAISMSLLYSLVVRKYNLPYVQDKNLLKYSKHLSVMNMISPIANNIDKILLFHFLGSMPVAIYSIAQIPVTQLQNVLGLSKQLSFGKLAKTKLSEIQNTLPGKIRGFFMAVVALAVLYIVTAPFIFRFLFPAYLEAVRYSQVLALLILAVPRTLVAQTFAAHQKTKELYIIRISAPLVKLVLFFVFLPLYGIWGAILALLLAELYTSALQWFLFYRAKDEGLTTQD